MERECGVRSAECGVGNEGIADLRFQIADWRSAPPSPRPSPSRGEGEA